MPLIPQVGRKSWSSRALIFSLYLVLSSGAVTMVYPFLLMISTSMKSAVDQNQYDIIPKYFYSDSMLYTKYEEDKYSGDVTQVNGRNALDIAKMEDVRPSKQTASDTEIAAWRTVEADLPIDYWLAGFKGFQNGPSLLNELYQQYCENKFHDIQKLNEAYIEENVNFQSVFPPMERLTAREWTPDDSDKYRDWLTFKASLPLEFRLPLRMDMMFQDYIKGQYKGDLKSFNANWGTNYKSLTEIPFPIKPPPQKAAADDWAKFIRERAPYRFIKLNPSAQPSWAAFLKKKYKNEIVKFDELKKLNLKSFEEVAMPQLPTPIMQADYAEFLKNANINWISIDTVENRYAKAVNQPNDARPPEQNADYQYVLANEKHLKRNFAGRNYRLVLNYIFLHGEAVKNTFWFCSLAVLTALIVNPLCAYALSRFPMKGTYKILLVILATMAFPAEVTLIPNFLLLKQLHLLNTRAALILPAMAAPFMIFLLKGFFDSLPKELFEAGLIDGAGEITLFTRVTAPLSKPIFAVIALQSFTAAYGAFMFAFLVCQDQHMWTMMVWLYELQLTAPKYVEMAALTIAAIPTLVIFIFAQNIILRGIIIPTSK